LKETAKPLAFIKDLLLVKSNDKKVKKGDFSLPVEIIGDLIYGTDGTYKKALRR